MISFLLAVRQLFRVLIMCMYVSCIIALSLLPPQEFPQVPLFEGADKIVHFLMYFIFSLLSCWSFKVELKLSRVFFIIPVTIGWGLLMEIFQFSMHVGRSFSWYDILANSLGVLGGIAVYKLIFRR